MTRWSCGRLAEADPHGHQTTSRSPAYAATGEAVCTCGHAAGRAGVLPTWTRADAVNERPHTGGGEGHAAPRPLPLVAPPCPTPRPTSPPPQPYHPQPPPLPPPH